MRVTVIFGLLLMAPLVSAVEESKALTDYITGHWAVVDEKGAEQGPQYFFTKSKLIVQNKDKAPEYSFYDISTWSEWKKRNTIILTVSLNDARSKWVLELNDEHKVMVLRDMSPTVTEPLKLKRIDSETEPEEPKEKKGRK